MQSFILRLSILLLGLAVFETAFGQSNAKRLHHGWQFVRQDLGSVWEAVRLYEPGRPEAVPVWEEVTLPHCFNAYDAVDPDINYYQGPGWYKTNLNIENPFENGRTLLHFEGAGQKTEVYVYTTKVGNHTGGYDEWTVDITEAVRDFLSDPVSKAYEGKIPISIRCDNSRDQQMIPSNLSDFNIYGGLYRYVNLVYVPEVSFDNLHIHTLVDAKGKQGEVRITSRWHNPDRIADAELALTVTDPIGKVVEEISMPINIASDEQQLHTFTLKNPALWSPDSPQLYTLKAILSSASGAYKQTEHFGFRHFEFAEKGPFYLNGERLLLRGTHRHEDHAGVAAAMTEDMIRHEMIMMKEMGANFIRLGHYQQSSIVLNLCDSLGILVWEEIPWCRGGLGGEVYREQARHMLRNMISQHYNHPSVIIWGLGNENDWPGDFPEFDKQKIRAFMAELNGLAHELDPSRKTAIRRCDFCKDIVDVYSPSIWAGWYRGKFTEYRRVSEEEMKKVNHFLHVEWGASSHAHRHSENSEKGLDKITTGTGADERAGDASLVGGQARVSRDGDWTETYACNLIDWHLKEQEQMDWLTGTAYWPFKDFSTPIRPDNPIPYMNQKGVVERDFTKKESYYVFQSYWTDKLMAHIYGHTWFVRWGEKEEKKMVKVYSNGEEAELFVNGESQGKRQRDSQDYPAAGLRWEVVLKKGKNDIRVVATKGKETVSDELTWQYQTENWGAPARVALSTEEAGDDTQWVHVQALDDKGVPCLDAKNWVRFDLSGDGKLLGDLGTSRGSRKVQMYNGRAMIKVSQPSGKSAVHVAVEGLPSEYIWVNSGTKIGE